MNCINAAISKALQIVTNSKQPAVIADDEAVAAKILDLAERYGFEPHEQYVEPLRAFLSGYGILLSGNAGVGKTFLFQCLGFRIRPANEIIEYGLSNLYLWYEWTDNVNICIDDLGTESIVSEYGAKDDIMKSIIAHRAERQSGLTNITTNMTAPQIAARYGDRTLSRILGMCKAFTLSGANKRIPTAIREMRAK